MRAGNVLFAGWMVLGTAGILQAQEPPRIRPIPSDPIQPIGVQVLPAPPVGAQVVPTVQPPVYGPHTTVVPTPPPPVAVPTPPGAIGAAQYPSNQPKTFVGRWLNKCGVCCGGHHNWFGTGSFSSQFHFLWGSSRVFFSEPCLPSHPYPPGIGGYGLQYADTYYGSHGNLGGERLIPGRNGRNFLGAARPACSNCE